MADTATQALMGPVLIHRSDAQTAAEAVATSSGSMLSRAWDFLRSLPTKALTGAKQLLGKLGLTGAFARARDFLANLGAKTGITESAKAVGVELGVATVLTSKPGQKLVGKAWGLATKAVGWLGRNATKAIAGGLRLIGAKKAADKVETAYAVAAGYTVIARKWTEHKVETGLMLARPFLSSTNSVLLYVAFSLTAWAAGPVGIAIKILLVINGILTIPGTASAVVDLAKGRLGLVKLTGRLVTRLNEVRQHVALAEKVATQAAWDLAYADAEALSKEILATATVDADGDPYVPMAVGEIGESVISLAKRLDKLQESITAKAAAAEAVAEQAA